MTLYEFNSKPLYEQYAFLWKEGIYLDTLVQGELRLQLYAIDRFFVEIHYSATSNKLIKLKTFKYGSIMDKYVNQST